MAPSSSSLSSSCSLFATNSISDFPQLSIWRFTPTLRFCPLTYPHTRLCTIRKPLTGVFAATKPTPDRRLCTGKITDEAGGMKVELGFSSLLLASMSFAVPIAAASDLQTLSYLPSMGSQSLAALAMAQLMLLDPGNAALATQILRPLLAALNVLFVVRIVMSWYPQLPLHKLPYVIAYAPTEPVLAPTRRFIPPVGGVDISPVIWVALVSFSNEILLGQQGLLVLLSQQQA